MQGEQRMATFLAFLPFIVFVLALPLVVYLVMSDPGKYDDIHDKQATAQQKVKGRGSANTSTVVAYGVLATILAALCALTVISHKGRT